MAVMMSQSEPKQRQNKVWVELLMSCVVPGEDGNAIDGEAGQRYKVSEADGNYLWNFNRAILVDGPHPKRK